MKAEGETFVFRLSPAGKKKRIEVGECIGSLRSTNRTSPNRLNDGYCTKLSKQTDYAGL